MARNWFPFAKQTFNLMKYSEQININAGIGVVGDYVFSANGIFDPNITGTGHQPYGFDTLMSMYSHYTVLRSKIKAWVANTSATVPLWLGVQIRDSATSQSGQDPSAILEQPGLSHSIVDVQGSGKGIPCVTSLTYDAKAFHGVSDVLNADDLQGTSTANPAEQAYWHIMLMPYVSTDDLASLPLWVEIEYEVAFDEPNFLSQS